MFRDNLWGDEGFTVLEKAAENSFEVFQQFSTYLSERAEIEDVYCKSLKRLTDPTTHKMGLLTVVETEEFKSVRGVWAAVKEEHEIRVAAHKDMQASITKILNSTREFAKDQRQSRRQCLEDAATVIRDRSSRDLVVKRAKARHSECVAKSDSINNNLETLKKQKRPASEIQKIAAKLQKTTAKEIDLEKEYKDAITALNDFQPTYVNALKTFMNLMQEQEVQRMDFIQQQTNLFSSALQQTISREKEAHDKLSKAASSISKEKDITEWVDINKTGSSPPQPPTFTPKVSRSRSGDLATIGQTPPAQSQNQRVVQALYDYIGTESDELDFFAGEKFELLDKDPNTGWWIGFNYGRAGWFPSNFVREVE
ncbi:hypothetical protein Pelo_14073 [Pelomyxa schiedti]|nr:hypothetical protein Pelo_14073 [Pelomyxa schiedti]